jgi:hypothetical protein
MERILDTPVPSLNGRGWRRAFRDELARAADQLDELPSLVVLTGGASRMGFVLDTAREIFGADRVVMGNEPELAIAKGLALAGRIGVRAKGFRDDIADLLRSDQVKTVVADHLPALAEGLGKQVADGVVRTHALPAFRRWKAGSITTLATMENEVADSIAASLRNPADAGILTVVQRWQNDLRPDLAELTEPICRRWGIPPSAMRLPPISVHDQQWLPALGIAGLLAGQAGTIAALVAAAVVAAILAALVAAGIALGPIGWMAGLWAMAGAAGAAEEVVEEKVRTSDLPQWIRDRFSETKVTNGAAEREAQLARSLAASIQEDEGVAIVTQVTARLRSELEELAREAELQITLAA